MVIPGLKWQLIQVLSDTVLEEVLAEVHASPFVGLLCDKSTDVSVTKQLVVYVKYITLNGDTRIRFWKLIDLNDGKTVSIEKALLGLCTEHKVVLKR